MMWISFPYNPAYLIGPFPEARTRHSQPQIRLGE